MITGIDWKRMSIAQVRSSPRVTMSPDAPSTLMEMVGVVLDPNIHPVAPKGPGTLQDLRPRLLVKQSA